MLAALPPPPVVLATSAASYLMAPAAGRRVTAWLEYPASRTRSPDSAASRRGDRLVVAARNGTRTQVVYDGGCSATQACNSVAAPLAGADGVLYAVADGRHADIASATLQRSPSRLVAQLTQPKGGPPPYTLQGPDAVWSTGGLLRARPPDGSAPARTLGTAPAGTTVYAVARREPVTAWLGRSAAGQDAVYEQLEGGRVTALYRETRAGVRLTALALLDGGRVAVVAMRSEDGARAASVLLVTPRQAEPEVLLTSVPSPAAYAYGPGLSVSGQSLAFRRRVGSERGLADQIVVLDVLSGTSRVVATARLRTTRLSDPSHRLRPRRLERRRDRGHAARALARARDARRERDARPGVRARALELARDADRLRAARRRRRRASSSSARPTRPAIRRRTPFPARRAATRACSARPAGPTCTAATAFTGCSTSSAARRRAPGRRC